MYECADGMYEHVCVGKQLALEMGFVDPAPLPAIYLAKIIQPVSCTQTYRCK